MRQSPISCSYNTPVKFHLRDYRAEDFDTLWKIDQQCFAPAIAYSRIELKFYIKRRGSFTLIAEAEGGSIAGFIVAEGSRRKVGHIITIDVLPPARRFGVGSELLHSAEVRLKTAGCGSVILETAVDNASAIAFYKRHGYFLMKTVPRYYSNGVDALVLEKDLTS
jgi:ribosomal-protein-alanine N-acetyltransferase